MNKEKPTILVVNDDGIDAPGIRALIGVMKGLGNVVVVAPDGPQSGMGHAITIAEPLRLDKVHIYPGQIIPIKTADAFQELLGKWHDCWVMAIHLKKTIDKGEVKSTETKYLEKIRSKLSSDCDMLLKQINATSI